MGNKMVAATDQIHDPSIEWEPRLWLLHHCILTYHPSYLSLITQKTSAMLLLIESCLEKAMLHHVALLSISQLRMIRETSMRCEKHMRCDTCVHVILSFLCCFKRQISHVSHLKPSRGRSGNYARDKGIFSCDKR